MQFIQLLWSGSIIWELQFMTPKQVQKINFLAQCHLRKQQYPPYETAAKPIRSTLSIFVEREVM